MYRRLLADADDIQIRLADRPRFIFRNLPRSPVLAHRMRVGLGQPAWIAHIFLLLWLARTHRGDSCPKCVRA